MQFEDQEIQHAATLYAWLLQRMGKRVPAWVQQQNFPIQPKPAEAIRRLAREMRKLDGKIPGDKSTLSLGDQIRWQQLEEWWFTYRESERLESEIAKHRKSALAKLTPEEMAALGVTHLTNL